MKHDYIPALALLAVSLLVSVYAAAHVKSGVKQVAVLFPLENNLQQNITLASNADTNIVRVGANDHVLILEENSAQSTDKLYDAGAVAIFDPMILGDCINKNQFSASSPLLSSASPSTSLN